MEIPAVWRGLQYLAVWHSMGKHNRQEDGGGNMEKELFFHILGVEETKEEEEIR